MNSALINITAPTMTTMLQPKMIFTLSTRNS